MLTGTLGVTYAGPVRISTEGQPGGIHRAVEATDRGERYVFHWYEIFPAMTLWMDGERRAVWLDSTCGDPDRDRVRSALRAALRMFEGEIAQGSTVTIGTTTVRGLDGAVEDVPGAVIDELQGMIDGGVM